MDNPVKRRIRDWDYYATVRYRTVALLVSLVLVGVITALIILQPPWLVRAWGRLTGAGEGGTGAQTVAQARFINLDGSVKVKRRDSAVWQEADLRLPLEAGDAIQTGPNGSARITFVDGTTYTVKPDTLITIEQNAALANRSTRVAVQVSSGAVDLSTGSWEVASSTSEVRFENATASMRQNTRAAVRQDPGANVHEITVSEGSADVTKGTETIEIGPYERASFRQPDERMRTEKVLAPPALVRPRNLEPIISANPQREVVRFEWGAVPKAQAYHLRVSTSPLFATLAFERRSAETSVSARGFAPGDYYWTVRALDESGNESPEGEPNRFVLSPQPATEQLLLNIESVVLHGRVIEVRGRTEPGATVTINAEPVASIKPDGTFIHFTRPLPEPGVHSITVVAQNRRGDVVTRSQRVIVR
jgi:hypothetical protein